MKHKKTIISAVFIFLVGGLYAQESPVATGGEASGTGGTVSYSVGQILYTTSSGTNRSVAHGVQQPYEISILVGIHERSINLEISVYPNPTTNYLTLKSEDNSNLSFQLYDLQGKIIEDKKVTANRTIITMEALAKATYFLRVTKNNQVIKTFKVIKN
jgi:hypothetical protein